MRITEKIVTDGKFWLPSDTENKITGKLTISDGGEIELELMDLFGRELLDKFRSVFNQSDAVDISRILGKVKEGPVTLDGCFYLSKTISSTEINKCRVYVNRAMFRVLYETNEIATFNTFSFSVEGLEEWLGISVIKTRLEYDDNDLLLMAFITYTRREDISLSSIDGIDIQLTFEASILKPSPITEVKIEHYAYIKLVSEQERPLSYFIDVATRLNSFFCFAIDETISIKDMVATSNSVIREGKKRRPVNVKIFYRSHIFSPKKPKIYTHTMLFRFPDIEDNSSNTIKNWLEMYETTDPAINLYLHKRSTYRYMEDKFLALAQGLEVYHQKIYKKEISLKDRLSELLYSFENFYNENGEIDQIAEDIAGVRNYLTHYDNNSKDKAEDAKTLYFLSMKMESIFQLHLLKKIGFTDEKIEQVIQGNHQLKRKLDMNDAT